MPIYEYYCRHCDGVFEVRRALSDASSPASCPVCGRKAGRIPPTSFAAFTMREGYPRAIPDRGTYYHLGKEVKNPIRGAMRMNEHPELAKPRPKPRKSKGDLEIQRDKREIERKEKKARRDAGLPEVIERWKPSDD
jgi:putative FmdB family regulatory protein